MEPKMILPGLLDFDNRLHSIDKAGDPALQRITP